jgi:pimeloyl-ACP methyl ester carboxylesterase
VFQATIQYCAGSWFNSDIPGRGSNYEQFAGTIDRLTGIVSFERYAIRGFDSSGLTGFGLAARHPDRVTAIISQNGDAYEDGAQP